MIHGIVAAGQRTTAASVVSVRPVYLTNSAAAGVDTSFSATLPTGWAAGDLAIMAISSSSAAAISLSGWSSVSTITSGGITSHLFWRVLDSGDTAPSIPSGGRRTAAIWLFQAGTFNSSAPVAQVATGTGTGTSASVGSGSSIPAGLHYQMQFVYSHGLLITPVTYPLSSGQRVRTVGTSSSIAASGGCGDNFDGGVPGAGSFGLSASVDWVSRKIAVIGFGGAGP